MNENINLDHRGCSCSRRRLLGAAALTFAATQLGRFGLADAWSGKASTAGVPPFTPGRHPSFATLK